ncbi:5-oxoprolinase subunit PxpB [Luteolibacter yonseiensis]|uniref:5-oxoprolinase subunit PxpB n=1 Tax=Luteolibacter yonseiensis TaxID=1144680 RepID=A0A934R1Q7_9BACT|nr:5-oxoprolinase subunit PxpB [Luteolibacter yonseiensis]MBK1814847.1 5-oxoprolinase subunit PxpB [Luteolibacter yonseiensis]
MEEMDSCTILRLPGIGKPTGPCKAADMTLKPLGDAAWLVEFPDLTGEAALARVTGLAVALRENKIGGVTDIVPSFASVAVHFDTVDGLAVREWIRTTEFTDKLSTGEEKLIPVRYGGEDGRDLAGVAAALGLSSDEVVSLHSGADYTVAAVGFSPGFPYLSGLPGRLRLPRLATPRQSVPAGSVAIAAGQAGIYPSISPGGWHLLGRTDVTLFDVHSPRPSFFLPGDRVRFCPVDRITPVKESTPTTGQRRMGTVEVIHPGGLTTVQNPGRPGHESSGVSPGGAVDRESLRMANLLVGNDESAACLECCVSGPILKFHEATAVALVSGNGRPRRVAAGETVDFSKPAGGVRSYLAIAGGICVPEILGSPATDVRAGFGGMMGRPLRAGDLLEIGTPGRIPRCGDWHVGRAADRKVIELGFLTGVQEDWFSAEARQRFRSEIYRLTPRSDRMGARLSGAGLELCEPREMISQPVACGSVQVPPDGQPIVLLAERQTIGGYPQIGHVISVDLPKLARAWPGTEVRFREVTWEEARQARELAEQDFKWLRTGIDLLA